MTKQPKKISVKCPTCGTSVPWKSDNLFRPFCSERCKLIDLGEWASDSRRIAGEEVNKDNETEDDS